MRLVFFFLSALLLVGCRAENSNPSADSKTSTTEVKSYSGDTLIVVESSSIVSNPSTLNPGREHDLQIGDTVRVVGKEAPEGVVYFRVHHDGIKGWLDESYALASPEHYQGLRKNNYEIIVTSQAFSKGNANEITLNIEFANISESRIIEVVDVTWNLFNEHGNPASTDTRRGNTMKTTYDIPYRGSIEPQGFASPAFDVGYSPEGSCAEIHRVKLEFADGGTSTYSGKSLREITRQAENVRLAGDCR